MWRITAPAFCGVLITWILANFVLGWFQHSVEPQTQVKQRPNRAADSQDQSCFCHVSQPDAAFESTRR